MDHEDIWLYIQDSLHISRPLTLDKHEHFFRLLPDHVDSERSWGVDIAERRRKAADEAEPLKRQARAKEQEVARLKEATPQDTDTDERIKALIREARELTSRAEGIENAVYDLKAVNPHAKNQEDTRTPEELLDLIEAKEREVAEALAILRAKKTGKPEVCFTVGEPSAFN